VRVVTALFGGNFSISVSVIWAMENIQTTKSWHLRELRLLVVAVCLIFVHMSGDLRAAAQSCDLLRVGGSKNWQPVAYINPANNQPAGIGYELVDSLGRLLKVPVVVTVKFPWARMMVMTREGELDVIAGIAPNQERAEYLLFSHPIHRTKLYAFVHRDSAIAISQVSDLRGFRRVIVRGSSTGEKLDELLKHNTMSVNNGHQLAQMIAARRADYFISTVVNIDHWQTLYPGLSVLVPLPLVIDTLDVVIAISKSSPCAKHLEQVNRIISRSEVGNN
jgi:polar amino acid transport system substrate-binding protein